MGAHANLKPSADDGGPVRRLLRLLALLLLLAGCSQPQPATAPPSLAPDPAEPGPLVSWPQCWAWNAFALVEQSSLAPLVPSNWTFTQLAQGEATLRLFLAECRGGSLLVLSTPMFTDEASKPHHENPDVVLEVFASDPATVANFTALGAAAHAAEFFPSPPGPTKGMVVQVNGTNAFTLNFAAPPSPAGHYNFTAVYAVPGDAGKGPIGWYWGTEDSPATPVIANYRLGPPSRLSGAVLKPYEPSSQWTDLALEYRPGTPRPVS